MNGEALTVEQIDSIAKLPSRDVLHGQLVGTIASPITGLVRGLNALIAGLAIQLQKIADEGLLSAGEAPAEPEAPAEEPAAAEEEEAEGTPAEERPAGRAAEAPGRGGPRAAPRQKPLRPPRPPAPPEAAKDKDEPRPPSGRLSKGGANMAYDY